MKRLLLIMMLCSCLFLSSCSCSVQKTLDDSKEWVSQAWKDTTSWISNAWGDSAKWISQAWKDSSKWVSDIWGDVSTWAVNSYNSVSGSISSWWQDTFNKSVAIDEAWVSTEKVANGFTSLRKYLFEVKVKKADNTKISVHDLIVELLTKLKLSETDAKKVLDTIKAYSEEKGFSVSDIEAIMLPYLLQLTNDSENPGNVKIPAIAVAQTLTGQIEKLQIKTKEDAHLLATRVFEIIDE